MPMKPCFGLERQTVIPPNRLAHRYLLIASCGGLVPTTNGSQCPAARRVIRGLTPSGPLRKPNLETDKRHRPYSLRRRVRLSPFFRLPEREMERREAPGVCETPPGPLRSGPAARHRGRVARPAREARAPVSGRVARPAARGCASRRSTCGFGRLADHARPAGRTSRHRPGITG
jgi:hypothetical protein